MTIVLPIVFMAVCIGLFARRVTRAHWWSLVGWIMLVVLYNYLKDHSVPK